jgi:hypothetical protein
VIVAFVVRDEIATLVTTRRQNRWSAAQAFYRRSWRLWARAGRGLEDPDARESYYSIYGPLSLLGLLVVWVLLFLAGWGLIWWALRDHTTGVTNFVDAVYFAGITFLTVGFGDITATSDFGRLLTVLEAFMGLTTMALVIGYLPTLYGAYSRREVQLLRLDDLTERVLPSGFIRVHTRGGDLEPLYAAFREWEVWCADVYDTHTAYPMLMLFRSRQAGRSWLTGLGIVLEASAYALATFDGPPRLEAQGFYRRALLLLHSLNRQEHVGGLQTAESGDVREQLAAVGRLHPFRETYDELRTVGVRVRPFDAAAADLQTLRDDYGPPLVALLSAYAAPIEFRTHARPIPIDMTRLPAQDVEGGS